MPADLRTFSITNVSLSDDRCQLGLHYKVVHEGKTFELEEKLTFPQALRDTSITDQLVRALHLVSAISYYKTFLPPKIHSPYSLSSSEASFWNTVYTRGLGELLYKNQINFDRVAKFEARVEAKPNVQTPENPHRVKKAMVGIGGGKDSLLAIELLNKIQVGCEGFFVSTGGGDELIQNVCEKANINLHRVVRRIDPQLFELQKQGYAGHIPISAIYAVIGCLLAYNHDCSYCVVGNEASSSIPQAMWDEQPIVHQWSKGSVWETIFQEYLLNQIQWNGQSVQYFSVLRPLSSIGVVARFSKLSQYHQIFSSDNHAFRIDAKGRPESRWGITSPKSLGTFLLLMPWIAKDKMLSIFGRDYLGIGELEEQFCRLMGQGEPILDCVGTPDELRSSMSACGWAREPGYLPPLMKLAHEHGFLMPLEQARQELLAKTSLVKADEPSSPHPIHQKFPPQIGAQLLANLKRDIDHASFV